MSGLLEAVLSITAKDGTGPGLASAQARVERFEKSIGAIAKTIDVVDKVAAQVAPVSARLNAVATQVNKVTAATRGLAAEELRLRQASADVGAYQQMTAALGKMDGQLVAAKTHLRAVWQEIGASAAPSEALQKRYALAQSSVARLSEAFKAQESDAALARASLEEVAGPLDAIGAAQARLAGEIARVNREMAAQGRIAATASQEMAAAVRKEETSLRRKAGLLHQFNSEVLPWAGPLILEGEKHAVETAAEVEQLRFRVREVSRKDPSEAPFADKLADDVAAQFPAITRAKAYDTYLELRANAASADPNVGIDQEKARRNLMAAAKAQTAGLALGFDFTPEDTQNLLKAVEGSGRADDPKAVDKITDAYVRAKQVFGTAIASSMVRDYVANAKSANFSIGDDQFFLANMVRMSEGNASRLGNEVNQTMASLAGGAMKKQAGDWFVEHGLARADQIEKTGGGNVRVRGGLKDSATLQTDQATWAATTLRAAIEAKGALSEDKVKARMDMLRGQELKRNPKAEIDDRFLRERAEEGLIAADLAKTGLRSTVTDNLAHFIGNQRLIERDIGQLQNASGTDAATRLAENPIAAFKELGDAISNFSGVLAGPAIKDIGPALDAMARGVAALSAAAQAFNTAHPDLAKALSGATLIGGAGLGGYLSWKLLSGFGAIMTGGAGGAALAGPAAALGGSASALDVAAAELSAAAAKLGAGSVANAAGKAGETAVEGAAGVKGVEAVVDGVKTAAPEVAQDIAPAAEMGVLAWLKGATLNSLKMGGPMAVIAGLAGWTTPEEDKILDRDIADETRRAEFGRKGRENAGLLDEPSPIRAALARRPLDPDVNALVDRDIERRNRNAPEDGPEARRGRALSDLKAAIDAQPPAPRGVDSASPRVIPELRNPTLGADFGREAAIGRALSALQEAIGRQAHEPEIKAAVTPAQPSAAYGAAAAPAPVAAKPPAREGAAIALSIPSVPVDVTGHAEVDLPIRIQVEASPEFRAMVSEMRDLVAKVPLAGSSGGRMDSDAAPRGAGGIGHQ